MEVNLKMDDATARRLYPTAAPEFKEMLEQNFGKDFFNKKVRDRIKNYKDICDELGVSSNDSDIKIDVQKFNSEKIDAVRFFIKAMQISEVYRQGRLPKAGENRYYAWGELSNSSPSCLQFGATYFTYDVVAAGSSAHLCFFTTEDAKDAFEKFTDVYSGLFGAKLILGMK